MEFKTSTQSNKTTGEEGNQTAWIGIDIFVNTIVETVLMSALPASICSDSVLRKVLTQCLSTRMALSERISKQHVVYSFDSRTSPVANVRQREPVVFEMWDGFGGQISSESRLVDEVDWNAVNPATGPISVIGSEKGDTLAVKILNLTLADHGIYIVAKKLGVLGSRVRSPTTRIAKVSRSSFSMGGRRFKTRPNIGVIGVAPLRGSPSCGIPGNHGGNLDTSIIRDGATVYLPVSHSGALFAMGDPHLSMGDGEVCGSGGGIGASATVEFRVYHHTSIIRPIVETVSSLSFLASSRTFQDAARKATLDAVTFLMKQLDIRFNDAYMICSAVCDLGVSQLVNPLKTARVTVPKRIFPSLRFPE